jgi:hypothetical protein
MRACRFSNSLAGSVVARELIVNVQCSCRPFDRITRCTGFERSACLERCGLGDAVPVIDLGFYPHSSAGGPFARNGSCALCEEVSFNAHAATITGRFGDFGRRSHPGPRSIVRTATRAKRARASISRERELSDGSPIAEADERPTCSGCSTTRSPRAPCRFRSKWRRRDPEHDLRPTQHRTHDHPRTNEALPQRGRRHVFTTCQRSLTRRSPG